MQSVRVEMYYTYAYLREDGTPYYIGKGRGRRVYDSKNRKSCKVPPKNRILFLKKNLTEEEAFKHEIYMIAVFGRKDLGTGILRNLTEGGEGFSSKQMELFWKKRNKEKRTKEFKKWRKEYDKNLKWREENREFFDNLIRKVIDNRTFQYPYDTQL
jgi:hypothetical protein